MRKPLCEKYYVLRTNAAWHTYFSETSRPGDEYLPVNKAFIASNDYPVPNECRSVVDWVSGNKFMWNLKQSTIIFKQEN